MKKLVLSISCLMFVFSSPGQHQPPAPPNPQHLHPSGPPPVPAYNPETHQQVEESVREVIREFKSISDSNAGIIHVNDTVNRLQAGAFPPVYITAHVEFPGKPQDNHIRHTFVKDFMIASRSAYDGERRNKYTDNRYIFDYKNQTITNLLTEKSGKKKATRMAFSLLNLSADGTVKVMTTDDRSQASSILETDGFEDISGYHCRKYLKKDPTGITEMWMTTDAGLENPGMQDALMKAFFGSTASIPNSYVDYKSILKGVPVRLVYLPQQAFGEKCIITYEKIEKGITDETVFSTDGYEVRQVKTLMELMKAAKE